MFRPRRSRRQVWRSGDRVERSGRLLASDFLETAERAAREAGQILQGWISTFTVRQKSCPADMVTEADEAAQRAIFELIHGRYPGHSFLGEEGLLRSGGDSPYRWIIDPLDGTGN